MSLDEFISAIRNKKKVRVIFFSKEDKETITRKCAPMDYGPSRRTKGKNERFHLWDYESATKNHTLSLSPQQVEKIEILDETFDPAEFVTWKTDWIISRDWGTFS